MQIFCRNHQGLSFGDTEGPRHNRSEQALALQVGRHRGLRVAVASRQFQEGCDQRYGLARVEPGQTERSF
jgi:hypothetical protein